MTKFRQPYHINFKFSITVTENNCYVVIRRAKNRKIKFLKNQNVFVGLVVKKKSQKASDFVAALERWIEGLDADEFYEAITEFPPQLIWQNEEIMITFDGAMDKMIEECFSISDFYTIYGKYLMLRDEEFSPIDLV